MTALGLYYIGIGILGPLSIFVLTRRINREKRRRTQHFKQRKILRATPTSTPLDNPNQAIKQEGLDNIESRFSIIETIVITTASLFWAALLVIPVLEKIPATVVSIFVGSSAVISGIAARPVIENFIAGIIITFNKPFKIGDTVVIDGHYGNIEDITTTHTVLKIWDWRRYVIPNSRMISKEFVNYTIHDTYIWTKVEFHVAYDTDLDLLERVAIEVAQNSPFNAQYEPPKLWVTSLDEYTIRCWLATWSNKPADAWDLGHDVRSGLIKAFRRMGIRAHHFTLQLHSQEGDKPPSGTP